MDLKEVLSKLIKIEKDVMQSSAKVSFNLPKESTDTPVPDPAHMSTQPTGRPPKVPTR